MTIVKIAKATVQEWAKLDRARRVAQSVVDLSIIGGTERQCLAAEKAWDDLVDFVEENDLNYTKYDPRGEEDPSDEELKGHKL
jgi:hypothetical protein